MKITTRSLLFASALSSREETDGDSNGNFRGGSIKSLSFFFNVFGFLQLDEWT